MKQFWMILAFVVIGATILIAADLYFCPMHPHITSDKPGKCPICGMNLVKRKEEGITKDQAQVKGYTPVTLTAAQENVMGVKTTKAEFKTFTKTISTYGYVAHDTELYDAQLEYIEAWRQYYVYASRRKTTDEFRGDWRQYYAAANTNRASEDFRKAKQNLIKAEYELRHMGLLDAELEKLRLVKYGQPWVQPEILFFDEGKVWIYAYIYEDDFGYVDVGQKVNILIPAYAEKYEGIIRVVSGVIDPMTHTARVRIEVQNIKEALKANMYVQVDIQVELNDGVIVPRDAVMDTGMQQVVFVKTESGRYEPRHVVVQAYSDREAMIKQGLTKGQEVVMNGNFLLDSESRLQAVLTGQ